MTQIEAFTRLNDLGPPTFRTTDAAALLKVTPVNAAKILARLSMRKSIVRLKHSLWAFPEKIDRLALPGYLSSPFPSYVSLQSALYYHDMIEQIPSVIYAVSIGRTKKFHTPLGDVSLHRIQPRFFCDYTTDIKTNARIATPEKALIDYLYLRPTKTRLFGPLPELNLPKKFSSRRAQTIITKIPSQRRRTFVKKEFKRILSNESL